MNFQDSIARLRRKARDRLSRDTPERERNGEVGPTNSPVQQVPHDPGVVEDGGNVDLRVRESDST